MLSAVTEALRAASCATLAAFSAHSEKSSTTCGFGFGGNGGVCTRRSKAQMADALRSTTSKSASRGAAWSTSANSNCLSVRRRSSLRDMMRAKQMWMTNWNRRGSPMNESHSLTRSGNVASWANRTVHHRTRNTTGGKSQRCRCLASSGSYIRSKFVTPATSPWTPSPVWSKACMNPSLISTKSSLKHQKASASAHSGSTDMTQSSTAPTSFMPCT
mmetsp:Transcript_120170/g.383665  ORF Transcript_120170/g.383665 Transcript_120170/m.383665 type:complete len:216 (-) Transcript_120170:2137-2784(-)